MTAAVQGIERRIVASGAMAHAMTHALELTFAALLVRVGLEYGADLALLGVVANVGTVTFGTTALPSGFLTDRFGPRAIITWCMAGAALFAFAVAAAPNLFVFAVFLSLLGAALGLYHPAGTSMVATVVERRGMAFAAHGIAGNIGVGAVPAIAIGISIATDWRMAYVVLGIAALGVALVVRTLAPSKEEVIDASQRASRSRVMAATGLARPRSTPPEVRTWFTRPLLVIYVCSIGTGFIYRGSLTFLEKHLEEHLGIELFGWSPEAVAGAMTSIALLTAVLGQAAGGWLSDRFPLEWVVAPVLGLAAPSLLLMSTVGGIALLIFTATFVIANFGQQPIINGLIADYAPEGAGGRAFGLSFFLVFGVGSMAGTICGVVANAQGTSAAFGLLAAVSAGIGLVAVMLTVGAARRSRAVVIEPALQTPSGGE
ncbi:MAG: MFS transporter [Dehalococcoidia bacterium]|nr:MFS transporter [Dehalococcoidia bacterium]